MSDSVAHDQAPPPLCDKVARFVSELDGYEHLDTLLRDVPEGERADYLFRNRTIIAEQKEQDEPTRIAWDIYAQEGHRLARKYNVRTHAQPLPLDLLSPEERRGFLSLRKKYIRRFESALSKANGQIASTKQILAIPEASGLFIMLNEKSGNALPQLFFHAAVGLFERAADDAPRFPHINGIFYVQNFRDFTVGQRDAVAIYMPTKHVRLDADAFGQYMMERWQFIHGDTGRIRQTTAANLPFPDGIS